MNLLISGLELSTQSCERIKRVVFVYKKEFFDTVPQLKLQIMEAINKAGKLLSSTREICAVQRPD